MNCVELTAICHFVCPSVFSPVGLSLLSVSKSISLRFHSFIQSVRVRILELDFYNINNSIERANTGRYLDLLSEEKD